MSDPVAARYAEALFDAAKRENRVEDAAAQFDIKVKSAEMKGTIYFDNKAGRVVVSTMNQKMNMEINAMGNIIESVVDQTVTVKLAK